MQWGNDRRHWLLPLVAGAEMNRLKPPPIFYYTSRPYPVIAEDSAGVAQGLAELDILGPPVPFDNSTVVSTVSLLELTTLLVQYGISEEPSQVSLGVTLIELVSILQAYAASADLSQVSLGTTAITLENVLIVYDRYPEELAQVSLGVSSITLT